MGSEARDQQDSPSTLNDKDSGGEYPSDEELSDNDVHLLNTDYALQRDYTFYPTQHQQHPYRQYNPSVPPHLRQRSGSSDADGVYSTPEKYRADPRVWDGRTQLPPRLSSLPKEDMYNAQSRSNDYRPPHYNAHAYEYNRQRVPLVDLIRNEWKNNPYAASSPPSPRNSSPDILQILAAPKFRRYLYIIFTILMLTWGNWHYWAGPKYTEHKLLITSLSHRMQTGEGWFGENMRPEFLDMVHVQTLDQSLLPQRHDRNRLIVIGDVHGCHDELLKLLSEVQFEARTDHLIFAGDFISKGPSSPAIIDLAMSAKASCVRGNHEDRVLLAYRDMYSHRLTEEQNEIRKSKTPIPPAPGMPENMRQNDDEVPNLVDESFEHGNAVDRELAGNLTKRQVDWMAKCPVILDIGQIDGFGDLHVVHAGLIPGVRLEKQDPMGVMHMRTIDLETHVPSSSAEGVPWFKLWNKYQTLLPRHQRSTVIYGHDSRQGLQLHPYSKGLDTGCVKGGKLTALIIDGAMASKAEPKVVSVRCGNYGKKSSKKQDELFADE